MQIAAVIAARFNAYPPNGASTTVAAPVQPISGEIGVDGRGDVLRTKPEIDERALKAQLAKDKAAY